MSGRPNIWTSGICAKSTRCQIYLETPLAKKEGHLSVVKLLQSFVVDQVDAEREEEEHAQGEDNEEHSYPEEL